MRGEMKGYHEVRASGGRVHYRLFCLLENASAEELERRGLERPHIAVICGMEKRSGEKFSRTEYREVRDLGDDYLANFPRRAA